MSKRARSRNFDLILPLTGVLGSSGALAVTAAILLPDRGAIDNATAASSIVQIQDCRDVGDDVMLGVQALDGDVRGVVIAPADRTITSIRVTNTSSGKRSEASPLTKPTPLLFEPAPDSGPKEFSLHVSPTSVELVGPRDSAPGAQRQNHIEVSAVVDGREVSEVCLMNVTRDHAVLNLPATDLTGGSTIGF